MPSATAILDRFLHHAEIIKITGKSYRLRNQSVQAADNAVESKAAKAPPGSDGAPENSKAAKAPIAGQKRADKVATGQTNASK